MRSTIFCILITLLTVSNSFGSGWVSNGNGTYSLTVTFTVTAQQKSQMEQCRADHNWRYFYQGQERDASSWLTEVLFGWASTKEKSTFNGEIISWWRAFVRHWISREDMRASTTQGTTEGLALSVPSPVPQQ